MSSLAAARADNYYFPKDWRPEDGSLNRFHGSHPLGKRAKGDGVLVVRFEMPFNVWCLHCETHIGRGVRFNARKRRVGAYFSTPLYEFRLTCATCKGEMVVETDPEHRGYKLVSGIKKQRTAADADDADDEDEHDARAPSPATAVARQQDDSDHVERLNAPGVATRVASDPFFHLEHENEDKRRAAQRAKGLSALIDVQDAQFKDDYASNAALRQRFRQEKKRRQRRAAHADALGLSIPLVDVHPEDVAHSKATVFKGVHSAARLENDARSATARGDSRRPAKRARSDDSFQHFGDQLASKLHRYKKEKQAGHAPSRRQDVDRVAARARSLLSRR
ncbi:hypothetical protein ATCC90586_003929 [Pythium insidiosum]|nr:hypothetical protein ATCC90586_003929 [Pythium insidiosum]